MDAPNFLDLPRLLKLKKTERILNLGENDFIATQEKVLKFNNPSTEVMF